MIRPINKKDESSFIQFCQLKDTYEDFYITQENKRYFLTDTNVAKKVFKTCYKRADICYISEGDKGINGIVLVIGYAEKANRKYVKLLAENQKVADNLLKYLNWNHKKDIHAKLNNKNPLVQVFKNNGFKFLGGRGSQTLLVRSKNGTYNQNYKKPSRRPITEGRV